MGLLDSYKTPVKYEIKVTVGNETVNDVNSYVVFRCPISKTSGFSVVSLSVKAQTYLSMEEAVRVGNYPMILVDVAVINPNWRVGCSPLELGYPLITFCKKNYLVIHVEPSEQVLPDSPYVSCKLFSVNPVLWYMSTTNSYNKVLSDTSAFDALTDFESHIKSKFGGTAFKFIKVGENVEKNDHRYEQINPRLQNDLLVPSWIIHNFKPWNTYAFYFFDDFRIDEDSTADLTAMLINLGDYKQFPCRDISKETNVNVYMANTQTSSQGLGDPHNELFQQNPSLIFKGNNMEFKAEKAKGQTSVPQIDTTANSVPMTQGNIQSVQTNFSMKQSEPTEETIIYAPDTIDNAKSRFEKIRNQLKADMRTITSYYLRDCFPDFLQFGYCYNISPYTQWEYSYTPLSIVNCFVRDEGQQPILTHHVRYQMIKFTNKDQQ